MTIFDETFNKASIYDMLFFNAKSVLIHPTLKDLEENDKPMFERWKYLSKTKHPIALDTDYNSDLNNNIDEYLYQKHAPNYPEFCRIVAITYATLYLENGQIKRDIKKVVNDNEIIVIETFIAELTIISNEALKAIPQFFPSLCGHNIIGFDIPLLIKRFILHADNFKNNKQLPLILKRSLNLKPWESDVIDVTNVWKFNGYEISPLMLIADYLGLKRTVDLLSHDELSKYYWDNINKNKEETLNFVGLQSATQINLVIQLMNKLRQL